MGPFKSEILMKRSSDILLPRALLSIQQVSTRPVLAMVYCEGFVEYRETTNMSVVPRDGKDQVSSMAQIGLYFPGTTFCKSFIEHNHASMTEALAARPMMTTHRNL